MATNTMLYIGFSFTDDYLNEFRAEVLKMLRPTPHMHVHYKTGLECLKRINKANLLSHFFDKGIHDDYLLDLKVASSQSDAVKARIKEIEGIQDSDVDEIEQFVKGRVVATSRRSNDFLELDKAPPIAYAIIGNKSQQQINYFRRHEGVQIMTWDTNGWFGGLDAYLDGILRQTSRPFLWGSFLTNSVLENNRVIITWDLGTILHKKVAWWLQQCLEFYRNASRHHKSLYQEATQRKGKVSADADDCISSTDSRSSSDLKRTKSSCSDIIVPVTSVETLRQALERHKDRVACVICPFGLSDGFLTAAQDEAQKQGRKTFNIYDASAFGRYQLFMSADHIVRLVQKVMAGLPPQFQCPFIVYANLQRDKVADSWRQECAMRCGAFGFACRTDELFELIKRVTDVYLPFEQTQTP